MILDILRCRVLLSVLRVLESRFSFGIFLKAALARESLLRRIGSESIRTPHLTSTSIIDSRSVTSRYLKNDNQGYVSLLKKLYSSLKMSIILILVQVPEYRRSQLRWQVSQMIPSFLFSPAFLFLQKEFRNAEEGRKIHKGLHFMDDALSS